MWLYTNHKNITLNTQFLHQTFRVLYQTQKILHQTFRILHQIIKLWHQTQKTLHQTFEIFHQINKNFTPDISFFIKPEEFYTKLEIFYTKQMALLGFRKKVSKRHYASCRSSHPQMFFKTSILRNSHENTCVGFLFLKRDSSTGVFL